MLESNTDFDRYVNEDELNYGTPGSPVVGDFTAFLDDQSETSASEPVLPLLQLNNWDPDLSYDDSPPTCIHYTIEWKLLLNRGRTNKLTNDTERDLVLAPGAYWDRCLKSKVEDILKKKTPPRKSYKLDETNISVSVTERGERDFTKRFDELDIDWLVIEKQLEDWSDLFRAGRKLRIEISFICKEDTQTSMITRSGRGATGAQLMERNGIIEGQQAAGQPTVWAAVYQLMRCSGHPCKNQGGYCFRDPDSKRHFPLDTGVMTKLVRFAEDGNVLDTHKDVPEAIRELIYAKAHESSERKQKRKASSEYPEESRPIKIVNVLPSSYRQGSPDSSAGSSPDRSLSTTRTVDLPIPEPRDTAIRTYCQWQCNRVTGADWKKGFQKAYAVAMKEFMDLAHIFEEGDVEYFVTQGVPRGIAKSFVRDIEKWASVAGAS
ncbi:hypothetical protein Purlil1_12178 [Purpureocillium lilacinum]|uniref:Uncharacterized protein n=1 Tax=Purpureocillium lilacinum TaxID=33203 RepID=A0ABR0BHJ9_PURLI|nr:hypothetical protein Purlil1_12178 [Purpureocillium lilacinum]